MTMQGKITAHLASSRRRNWETLMYSTFKFLARALPAVAMVTSIACGGGTPVAPESANPATAGTIDAAADGSTLKATAPTLISPTGNVELATMRPALQIGESSGRFASGSFDYEFEIQNSSNQTVHRQTVGGTTSVPGEDLQVQSSFRWRARAVLSGKAGPWSDFATFRTISVPGCINGLLLDPEAYFFHVINRKKGDRARDWFEVMANSGIPAGPPPGVDPGPEFYGMTQQSGAAGPRGRIFLPALDSDALGYRVSAWDILENSPAGLVWTFKFFDGGGYAPRPCP
jgi:hypothetical protein